MSKDDDDYEVGYGKPPRKNQFKKGRSGNPGGRVEGSKNIATDLREELAETVKIKEGGRKVRLTKRRLLIKSQVAKAIKGDPRSFDLIMNLAEDLTPELMEEVKEVLRGDAAADIVARFIDRIREGVEDPTEEEDEGDDKSDGRKDEGDEP